ncbi:MAG TPA: hypothetical protein VI793_01360 [Anaerolineales bacterium]|nr:hypothetical protein [Anaerolineales bacterium]
MTADLIAGSLSGIAGLLVFLVIHHFWIRPIWFILPVGLMIAGFGGLAAGWSYTEIKTGLPPRPWAALALVAVIGVILAPSILLAQLRQPLINITTGIIPPEEAGRVTLHFVLELLITAGVVGGLAGWLLGHTLRAAMATALAGLVFALGPGHNIPFLGSTPAVGKGLVLLLAITLVSALVLVETSAGLVKE